MTKEEIKEIKFLISIRKQQQKNNYKKINIRIEHVRKKTD